MEEINFDVYKKYLSTITRYMELIPCEQKEKVDVTTLHVTYAIQDINNQLNQYVTDSPELSIFYPIMIKTDFLISAVEMLYKILMESATKEISKKDIWGKDFEKIKQFRLYRSLTLAHPLETTRYKDLGFGKENNKWCEDVHPKNRAFDMMDKNLCNADYIIEIKEKGKDFTEQVPISIKDDIVSTALIAMSSLDCLTENHY